MDDENKIVLSVELDIEKAQEQFGELRDHLAQVNDEYSDVSGMSPSAQNAVKRLRMAEIYSANNANLIDQAGNFNPDDPKNAKLADVGNIKQLAETESTVQDIGKQLMQTYDLMKKIVGAPIPADTPKKLKEELIYLQQKLGLIKQINSEEAKTPGKRGRPPKPKAGDTVSEVSFPSDGSDDSEAPKKPRGRPKGTTNAVKDTTPVAKPEGAIKENRGNRGKNSRATIVTQADPAKVAQAHANFVADHPPEQKKAPVNSYKDANPEDVIAKFAQMGREGKSAPFSTGGMSPFEGILRRGLEERIASGDTKGADVLKGMLEGINEKDNKVAQIRKQQNQKQDHIKPLTQDQVDFLRKQGAQEQQIQLMLHQYGKADENATPEKKEQTKTEVEALNMALANARMAKQVLEEAKNRDIDAVLKKNGLERVPQEDGSIKWKKPTDPSKVNYDELNQVFGKYGLKGPQAPKPVAAPAPAPAPEPVKEEPKPASAEAVKKASKTRVLAYDRGVSQAEATEKIGIEGRGESPEEFHYNPNEGKANIPHGIAPGIKGQVGTPGLANSAEEEQEIKGLRAKYLGRKNRQTRADENNKSVTPLTEDESTRLADARRYQQQVYDQALKDKPDQTSNVGIYTPEKDPRYGELEVLRHRLEALEKHKSIVENRPETQLTKQDLFGEFNYHGELEWKQIESNLDSLEKYRLQNDKPTLPTSDRTDNEPRSASEQAEVDRAKETNAQTADKLFKNVKNPTNALRDEARATSPVGSEEDKAKMEGLKKEILGTIESEIKDIQKQLTDQRIAFNSNLRGSGSNLVYNQKTGKLMDNGFETRIDSLQKMKKQLEETGTVGPGGKISYDKGKQKYFNDKASKLRRDIEKETGGEYTFDKSTMEIKPVNGPTDESLQVKTVAKQDPLKQSYTRRPDFASPPPPPPNNPPTAQAAPEPEPEPRKPKNQPVPRKGIKAVGEAGPVPLPPNKYYPKEFPHENDDKQKPAFIGEVYNSGETPKPKPTETTKINEEADKEVPFVESNLDQVNPRIRGSLRNPQSLTAQYKTPGLTMSAEDEAALKAARAKVGSGFAPGFKRMQDQTKGAKAYRKTPGKTVNIRGLDVAGGIDESNITPEMVADLERQGLTISDGKVVPLIQAKEGDASSRTVYNPNSDPRVEELALRRQEVKDLENKKRRLQRKPNLELPRESTFNIHGQYDDHDYDKDLYYYVDRGEILQARLGSSGRYDNEPRTQKEKDELAAVKTATRAQAEKLYGNKPNYNQQELEEALKNQPLASQVTKEKLEEARKRELDELNKRIANEKRLYQSAADKYQNELKTEGTGYAYDKKSGTLITEDEYRKNTVLMAKKQAEKAKQAVEDSKIVTKQGIVSGPETQALQEKYESLQKRYDQLAEKLDQTVRERTSGEATYDAKLGEVRSTETDKKLTPIEPRSKAKPKAEETIAEPPKPALEETKLNLREIFKEDYERIANDFKEGRIDSDKFLEEARTLRQMAEEALQSGELKNPNDVSELRAAVAPALNELKGKQLPEVKSITEKVNDIIGDVKTPGTALQPGERTAALEKSKNAAPKAGPVNASQKDLKKLEFFEQMSEESLNKIIDDGSIYNKLHPDTVKAMKGRLADIAAKRNEEAAKLPIQKPQMPTLSPSAQAQADAEKDLKDKLQQREDTIAALRQVNKDLREGKENAKKYGTYKNIYTGQDVAYEKAIELGKGRTQSAKMPIGPTREGYKLGASGEEEIDTTTQKGKQLKTASDGLSSAFKNLINIIGQVNKEYEKQKSDQEEANKQTAKALDLADEKDKQEKEKAQKAEAATRIGAGRTPSYPSPIGPAMEGYKLDASGNQVFDKNTPKGKEMADLRAAQEKQAADLKKQQEAQAKADQKEADAAQKRADKIQAAALKQSAKDAKTSMGKSSSGSGGGSGGSEDETGVVLGKIGLGLRKGVGWARRTAGFSNAGVEGMIGGFTALAGSEIFNKVTQALGALADQAKQTAASVKDFGGSNDKITESQFSLNAAKTRAANNPGVADMSNFMDTLQNRFWGGVDRVGTAIHGVTDFFGHIGESEDDKKKRMQAEYENSHGPVEMKGDTKIQYDEMLKSQGEAQQQMAIEREQAEHDIFTQRRDYALKGKQIDQDAQHQYEDFAQQKKFTDQDYSLSKEKLEADTEFKSQQKKFEIGREFDKKKLDQNIVNQERTAATDEKYMDIAQNRTLKLSDTKFQYQQSDNAETFGKNQKRALEDYQNQLVDMSFSGGNALDFFKKSRDTRLALKRAQEDFDITKRRDTRDYNLQREDTVQRYGDEKSKRREQLTNTETDQKEKFKIGQDEDLAKNKVDVESHYVQLRFETLNLEQQHNQALESINLNLKQFNDNLAIQKEQYANQGQDMQFSQTEQWKQLQLGQQQQAWGQDQDKMNFAWQLYQSVGQDTFARLAMKTPSLWDSLDRYTKQAGLPNIRHGASQTVEEQQNAANPVSGTLNDGSKSDWNGTNGDSITSNMTSTQIMALYNNRANTSKGGVASASNMTPDEWLAAIKSGQLSLPSYSTGGFIEQDQIAQIHKGEYIINPNNPDRTNQMGILGGAMKAMQVLPVGSLAQSGGSSSHSEMAHSVQIGDTVYNGIQSEALIKEVTQAHEEFKRKIQQITQASSDTLRKEFGTALKRVSR